MCEAGGRIAQRKSQSTDTFGGNDEGGGHVHGREAQVISREGIGGTWAHQRDESIDFGSAPLPAGMAPFGHARVSMTPAKLVEHSHLSVQHVGDAAAHLRVG